MPGLPALAVPVDEWQLPGHRSGRYEGVKVRVHLCESRPSVRGGCLCTSLQPTFSLSFAVGNKLVT